MKKVLILFYLACCSIIIYGQQIERELYGSGGAISESSSLTVSWTIGETHTETYHSEEIELNQGFQQFNYVITNIAEESLSLKKFELYPNPVNEVLNINYPDSRNYTVEVYDMSGAKINNYRNPESVNFSNFSEGTYLMRIAGDGADEIFKIQKIKY